MDQNTQLVLALARRDLDGAALERLGVLEQSADWTGAAERAVVMGLFPLFAHHAAAYAGRDFRDRLRSHAAYTMLLLSEHERITEAFQKCGIAALPVKGPTLAEKIYGSAMLRESIDLDYVVPRSQREAACRALQGAGYVPEFPFPKQQIVESFDFYTREFRFVCPTAGVNTLVEVHWDVFPAAEIEPRDWTDETYALYLALHGSKHLWQPMKFLCDFRDWILVHEKTFDWGAFLDLAARQRLRRLAATVLHLSRRILDAPVVPPEVETALVPVDAARFSSLVQHVRVGRPPDEDLLGFHRLRAGLFESRAMRLRYMLHLLRPTISEIRADESQSMLRAWARRFYRLLGRL